MYPLYKIQTQYCIINGLCRYIEEVIVEESNIMGKLTYGFHFFGDELECSGDIYDIFIYGLL